MLPWCSEIELGEAACTIGDTSTYAPRVAVGLKSKFKEALAPVCHRQVRVFSLNLPGAQSGGRPRVRAYSTEPVSERARPCERGWVGARAWALPHARVPKSTETPL